MSRYDEYTMQAKINACLQKTALVLDSNRNGAVLAADAVSHQYRDKFLLAEHLTNTSIACCLNSLEQIGFTRLTAMALKEWSARRAVSLRFERNQRCKFIKEIEREVEDPSKVQVEGLGGLVRSTVKVITKIKEWEYVVEEDYKLTAFSGVGDNASESITILSRKARLEFTTRSSVAPFSEHTSSDASVNITWLLQHLDVTAENATFVIDRAHAACATPSRNADIEPALSFSASARDFCARVCSQLSAIHSVQARYSDAHACKVNFHQITAAGLFNPVVPLFEEHQGGTGRGVQVAAAVEGAVTVATAGSDVALPRAVVNTLLLEHRRSLAAACADVEKLFIPMTADGAQSTLEPAASTLFTAAEGKLLLALSGLQETAAAYALSVQFIEEMLRSQLVAAIGKEVTVKDFSQYMIFHNRKVFREQYQPKPFSYAVRRSAVHSPEGQIQIVMAADSSGGSNTPQESIYTVSQGKERGAQMEFALNATTTVKFGGERHVHGWMAHRFSGQELPQLKLVAQSRQFSSYIVLIGRIASAKLFQPKYGFIVQNKDELTIPLELEQIPTAKEFKDAISSLSPEQQRFAKAYRSMQLESTLFAVCVIQIKPQLEKVLKLHADSLTKEIKLTQDLMQLFIKYQIPTDLLSFEQTAGVHSANPTARERLLAVKGHVQSMQDMLTAAKNEEIAEAELQRKYLHGSVSSDGSASDVCFEEDDCAELCAEKECDMFCEDIQLSAPPPQKRSTFVSRVSKMVRRLSGAGAAAAAAAPSNSYDNCKSACKEESMPCSAAMDLMCMEAAGGGAAMLFDQAECESGAPPAPAEPAAAAQEPAQEFSDGKDEDWMAEATEEEAVDYTLVPNKLEEAYTRYDPDSCLRPTIINPGATWEKRAQAGLLAAPTTQTLYAEEQTKEKDAAFDLLDALTRSGALVIEHASLHVVIAATHCFDQSVMDTLVQRNVNPIERVERSTLIMASVLNDAPALALVQDSQAERIGTYSPALLTQLRPAGAITSGNA